MTESIDRRVASSLSRIAKEAVRSADPFFSTVQEKLQELGGVLLEEYPFIRCLHSTQSTDSVNPSYLLIGTIAGYANGSKILSDGAVDNVVLKHHQDAVMYTSSKDGWSFRMYRVPYREGMKLRFWIHVDKGGKKGDHPGSRQFFVTRDGAVTQISKEEYERQ